MKKTFLYIAILILSILSTTIVSGQTEPLVRKIKIKGNREFSSKEIKEHLSVNASSWVGRKVLGQKASYYSKEAFEMNVKEIENFYRTEGFIHVVVEDPETKLNSRRTKIKLTFRVEEGDPVIIDQLNFHSEDTLWSYNLKRYSKRRRTKIESLPDSRFRDESVINDQTFINEFIINKGYAYSQVEHEITADSTVDKANINWLINPGPLNHFGEVSIAGAERTPERLIRKQLAFKKGDLFSREDLNNSQAQIYQLGTFRIASIQAKYSDDQKDTIPIEINITEAPQHSIKFGVGYGREDRFRTFIDYQILNFTGGARRLHLFAKHSYIEPYRIEATLTQPAVFGPNSTLSLSPTVRKTKEVGYELFGYGANIKLQQKISSSFSASFNPYYENINLDTTSVAKIEDIDLLKKSYSKSGVAIGALFDDTSPKFNPSSGWTVAVNTKANSTIISGKYPFLKYQAEIKRYQKISYTTVLAMKLKGGMIHPVKDGKVIPVEERFFAGGSRSVRGWARQRLGPSDSNGRPTGGNSNIELSIEPRVKIYGPLSWVVFFDAGNVWTEAKDINPKDLRYSVGTGIRYDTPIGPVGIDFARPIWDSSTKWQFHINIGHAF